MDIRPRSKVTCAAFGALFMMLTAGSVILAAGSATLAAGSALAQQPTPEQTSAIRASCRSDFMAHCSGVTPGGKEALDCLIRSEAKLSAACRTAVSAAAPKPAAPAVAEPTTAAPTEAPPKAPTAASAEDAQLKLVQQSCTLNDFMAHCSWIKPSSPEVVLCLKANAAELSSGCKAAVAELPGATEPPAAARVPTVAPAEPPKAVAKPAPARPAAKRAAAERSAPSSPAPTASAHPTAQQQSAIRAACRSDFMSRCSGVTPGGAEALQCLKRNAAELSPGCRSAVAAIGGGAPAAEEASSGASAAAPAAAPAVAPITLPPFMRPRKRLVIMAICDGDARRFCRGASPMGGRMLDCLAANAASVSPTCYQALARAAHEE